MIKTGTSPNRKPRQVLKSVGVDSLPFQINMLIDGILETRLSKTGNKFIGHGRT
jgi:hypothetical protein